MCATVVYNTIDSAAETRTYSDWASRKLPTRDGVTPETEVATVPSAQRRYLIVGRRSLRAVSVGHCVRNAHGPFRSNYCMSLIRLLVLQYDLSPLFVNCSNNCSWN